MTREERIMNDAMEAMKGGEEFVREHASEIPYLIRDLHILVSDLQAKLAGEKSFREWVQKTRMKGYVCGYLSRTSGSQLIAHQSAELYEKEKLELRKLANNPILSAAARKTLRRAEWMVQHALFDHNRLMHYVERERENAR